MREHTPLIEHAGSDSGASSATTDASRSSSFAGVDGPSVTFNTGAAEYTLTAEDLLVYASVVQTLLLVLVTYYELRDT